MAYRIANMTSDEANEIVSRNMGNGTIVSTIELEDGVTEITYDFEVQTGCDEDECHTVSIRYAAYTCDENPFYDFVVIEFSRS